MFGFWKKTKWPEVEPLQRWEYSEYIPVEPQPSIRDQFQEVLERLDRIEKKIEELNNE